MHLFERLCEILWLSEWLKFWMHLKKKLATTDILTILEYKLCETLSLLRLSRFFLILPG